MLELHLDSQVLLEQFLYNVLHVASDTVAIPTTQELTKERCHRQPYCLIKTLTVEFLSNNNDCKQMTEALNLSR